MATTVSTSDQGVTAFDSEIHFINWENDDATEEITVNLSEIHAFSIARVGATDVTDLGICAIDETATSGVITVASSAITVIRDLATAGGTLVTEEHCLILWGKS